MGSTDSSAILVNLSTDRRASIYSVVFIQNQSCAMALVDTINAYNL